MNARSDPRPGARNMPAAEVEISMALVRRLLAAQHPDLAALPLTVLAAGWDNVNLCLGDGLVVRLPRRAAAAELVCHEQRWLPELAPSLPLPVPVPTRVGGPGFGYPWAWSIVPLLPGRNAATVPPADSGAAAGTLGRFLGALHMPAPDGHPVNPVRGGPLASRDAVTTARTDQLSLTIDSHAVRHCWRDALSAPAWTGRPRWLHGDLHPANILVHDGALSAIVDFGDITAGDPATDLSVVWMMLPAEQHEAFRAGYEDANGSRIDDATWARARGWALALALAFLANSADNAMMAGIGRRTVETLLS